MTAINTNIASLRAQVALMQNSRGLYSAMQQLSTGKRLNSAADDAAGIAIVATMHGQVRSLNQEIRNANDGISLLQTADGATEQVTQMLQRMRELVSQGLNGTYSTTDIGNMGSEIEALQKEIDRIASDTSWNGTNLLDGTYTSKTIQISDANSITLATGDMKTTSLGVDSGVIDFKNAISSGWIKVIDTAISTVSTARATMGAMVNRLNYAVDNLTNTATNLSASTSRIEDADYSIATSELAKHQILQQAATAMLAQANQQPQLVLSLLK
jgi:flagellin